MHLFTVKNNNCYKNFVRSGKGSKSSIFTRSRNITILNLYKMPCIYDMLEKRILFFIEESEI